MAGETPAGAAVEAGGGEGVKAELVSAGVDVVRDSLEALKVLDLAQIVAGFLQQRLVDDDAEALIAVADGNEVALFVIEVEVIGGELFDKIGVAQIEAVLAPGLHGAHVADLEHGRSGALVHLGGQRVVILAGSGGNDLDRNAGLLGVQLGKILPGLIGFGLEVQVIDLTAGRVAFAALVAAAACEQSYAQNNSQKQCECFLHVCASPFHICPIMISRDSTWLIHTCRKPTRGALVSPYRQLSKTL